MKIFVKLHVADGHQVKDVIEIEEHKLGELSDEEIEASIEMRIRSWVDRMISVEWEAEEEKS